MGKRYILFSWLFYLLVSLGVPASPQLNKYLENSKSTNPETRRIAIINLASLNDRDAISVLTAVLQDPNWEI